MKVRNKVELVLWSLAVTCFALGAMMLHVQINYDPDFRPLVRGKAAAATVIVSFPLALFFLYQMLRNYRLSMELQRLVDRDRLTDIATRDYFFARLLDLPEAYGVSLMVDIDHFKQVNDTYGHLAGDTVIREVAQIIRRETRDTDIVCRFGGEEFVVFLTHATPQEGWVIAERVRRKVESAVTDTDAGEVRITVSLGGSLKDQLEDVDAAIKRADECLYRAKAAGRNKTIVDWSLCDDQLLSKAS